MTITELLDGLDAKAKAAAPGSWHANYVTSISDLVAPVDAEYFAAFDPATTQALTAAIRGVLELHGPWHEYPECGECRNAAGDFEPYPCPTVRTITDALRPLLESNDGQ